MRNDIHSNPSLLERLIAALFRSKRRIRYILTSAALSSALAFSFNAYAANYDVGAGKTYTTLEALRTTPITWANGDTITLYNNDSTLTAPFQFNTGINVTIQGSGTITPSSGSIRFAETNAKVTISSTTLVFSGFQSTTNGGAIGGSTGSGTVEITAGSNTFAANQAIGTTGQGGAIHGAAINLTGGKNTFGGVTTAEGNTAGFYGGAISSTGNILLSNTTVGDYNLFQNNSAVEAGGAIYTSGSVTLSGGANTFITNEVEGVSQYTAYTLGGAICAAGPVLLSGGTNTFTDNQAHGASAIIGGGAISSGNSITLSGGTNTFTGNDALNAYGSGSGYGGAIYNSVGSGNHSITLSGGTNSFTNNTAKTFGGAIFGVSVGSGTCTINISAGTNEFIGNESDFSGGAIFGNFAAINLGTLGSTDTLLFENNKALGGTGGAISNTSEGVKILGGVNTFKTNSAVTYGGAIDTTGAVTISSGTNLFTGNKTTGSSGSGGAIYGTTINLTGGQNTFGGATTTDANKANQGGAIWGNTIVISAATASAGDKNLFQNNSATGTDGQGGAIYANNSLTISGGTNEFVNNTLTGTFVYGGAIYGAANSTITLSGGLNTFTGNKATGTGMNMNTGQGGVIYTPGTGTIKISAGTNLFQNNFASSGGGVIFGNTSISGGLNTFLNNTSQYGSGGAIYGSNIAISAGTNLFQGNKTISDGYGGAITGNMSVIISGGKNDFISNEVYRGGGAIYSFSNVEISDGENTFTANTSDGRHGGAILSQGSVAVSGGTNTFTKNHAQGVSGGAIAGDDSVTISGGVNIFGGADASDGNIGGYSGGAIYSGGSIIISDDDAVSGDYNLFENNTATIQGGGAIRGNSVTLDSGTSTFRSNTVTGTSGSGGAIYGYTTVTLSDGVNTFQNNTATGAHSNGGAIYGGNISIAGGTNTFENNSVGAGGGYGYGYGYGGAIGSSGTVSISNGTNKFVGNSTTEMSSRGAAIGSVGAVTISGGTNTFQANTAAANSGYGGAIHSDANITLSGGKNLFGGDDAPEGNEAYRGGAISGGSGSIITLSGTTALAGDYNKFKNNSAISDGGAISGSDVVLSGGTNIFESNTVTSTGGNGGAITSSYNASITGGTNTFTGNTTGQSGGAISGGIGAVTISGGTNTFTGNATTSGAANNYSIGGGAIYGWGTVSIIGGINTFENNSAISVGGAIYALQDATLIAQTGTGNGNIIFRGNTANGNANALYMYNNFNNHTLTLAAAADRSILFYDPIASNSSSGFRNLKIDINGGTNASGVTGGTILFDTHRSSVYGTTTVYGGTMELANGAIYGGSTTTNASFTRNSGATLLSDTAGNRIQANAIVLGAGGILEFNMDGAVKVGTGSTTNLFLDAGTSITSVAASQTVKITDFTGGNGTYNLAVANKAGAFTDWDTTATLIGITPTSGREKYGLVVATTGGLTNDTLQLSRTIQNGLVKWDTSTGGTWDATAGNWAGQDTTSYAGGGTLYGVTGIDLLGETEFVDGDAVWFTGTGGSIVIDSGGVTIAKQAAIVTGDHLNPGMEISSGSWIFTGGDINGTSTKILFSGSGSISFGGTNASNTRTMQQRIDVANGVAATIKAENGKTVIFNGFTGTDKGPISILVDSTGSTITLGEAGSTGELLFSNNSALGINGTGGAIHGRENSIINLVGGVNTFTGNMAGAEGGAIHGYTGTTITISGGTNTFTGNKTTAVDGKGGAIYNDATITISGGTNTFGGATAALGNTASLGGAIYGSVIILSATDDPLQKSTFQNNSAVDNGGAIYASNNVSISDGTNIFTGNTTGQSGGAISAHLGTVTISGGTNMFTGNTTTLGSVVNNDVGGGAINGSTVNIIGGINTFENNSSTSSGGAIHASMNATLIAQTGDGNGNIIFRGNKVRSSANAIYMYDNGGNTTPRTLTLAAATDRSILFYDPIAGNSTSTLQTLTIDINGGANASGVTGGTILFDTYRSNIYGNTTVYGGTMQLTNGAIYGGAGATNPSFTLNDDAILLSDAKGGVFGNRIAANSITLQGNSILAFDMTGAVKVGTGSTINLVLAGTSINSTFDTQTVRIDSFTGGNGVYNLAQGNAGTFTNWQNATLIGVTPANGREKYGLVVASLGAANNTLQLHKSFQNGVVLWDNSASVWEWDTTNDSWIGQNNSAHSSGLGTDLTGETTFANNDAVLFNGSGGTIEIQSSGVTIAQQYSLQPSTHTSHGMEFISGDWVFTGGEIIGGGIHFMGSSSISFDTRTMNQRITIGGFGSMQVKAEDGETVTFTGFTGSSNGGAIIGNNGYATIRIGDTDGPSTGTMVFSNNNVTGAGGAIYNQYVVLADGTNIFENNEAKGANTGGGAIYFGNVFPGSFHILDGNNTFTGNKATGADSKGGAIYGMTNSTVELSGGESTFTSNTAVSQGGAIYNDGDVTLSGGKNTFGGTNTTDGNTAANGGAIYSSADIVLSDDDAVSGDYNLFENNSAGYLGGAIKGDTITLDSGTNTFKSNSATGSISGRGGAIYGDTIVTILDGVNVFEENEAAAGGAIVAYTVNIIDGSNTFEKNSARLFGGAIYGNGSGSSINISGGANDFSENTAVDAGGAIYGDTVNITGGTNSFSENTVTFGSGYGGGAIYGNNVNVTGGVNTFEDNSAEGTAGGLGGAIYASQNATLIAKTGIGNGDITFQGNTDSTGRNAIYMQNFGNDKTLTLAAETGKSILFYDPVASNAANSNLTIDINTSGGANAIAKAANKTGGTVLFDKYHSDIYGSTTVYGGTMQLTTAAIYGAANNVGSFTLNSGATLLSDVNSNTIQANSIAINAGSILAFDMTGAIKVGAIGETTNLLLLSDTSIASTFSTQTVRVESFTGGTGTYNLAIGNEDSFENWENATLWINGATPTNVGRERFGLFVETTTYANDTLQLKSIFDNGVMLWDGASGAIWNESSANWIGQNTTSHISGDGINLTGETKFLNGDAVWFDGSGGMVEIASGGVRIAAQPAVNSSDHYNPGMEISSGNWIFTGGDINDGNILFSGNGSISFGGLNATNARTIQQHITVLDNVTAGIKAENGDTATFKGLTTTTNGGAITAGSNSTVNLGASGSTGKLVFSNNEADVNGGAIYGNNSSVNLTGGTNSFTSNSAAEQGGAIWGDTVTLYDGENTFKLNSTTASSTGRGGAIYGDTIELLNGTNVFEENYSNMGGAIYGMTINIVDGTNTFEKNSAGFGGVIFGNDPISSASAVNITGGTNTFSENKANTAGGVFAIDIVNITAGTNSFTDNETTGTGSLGGGAIYSGTVSITGGENEFTGNKTAGANSLGGAIYASGNATLIAKDGTGNGDIMFQGNTDSTGANAIYMQNNSNNKTLTLAAETGRSILFYDPITSDSTRQNLTIDINTTGGANAAAKSANKTGGTVLFDDHLSDIYGNTTVYGGTMQLTNGATYGGSNSVGSFTLNDNATLLSDVKGNTIQAGTITIGEEAILAFNMSGAVSVEDAGTTTTNLLLNGTTIVSTFDDQTVQITSFSSGTGTYNLAIGNSGSFTGWKDADLYVNGSSTWSSGRETYGLYVETTTYTNDTLQLKASVQNGLMKWDTSATTWTWDATNSNWIGQNTTAYASGGTLDGVAGVNLTGETEFVNGDAVWFDGTGGTIVIDSAGVTIGKQAATAVGDHVNPGMEISSGDWIFTGGDINDGNILFSGNGSISFDTRSVTQHIDVANGVEATIKAEDTEIVAFNGFTTTGNGGVVTGSTGSTINLGDTSSTGTLVFSNNTADEYGGAIYGGTVNLLGGTNTFDSNSATGMDNYGGAIYSAEATNITGGTNTFVGNLVPFAGETLPRIDSYGGAIYSIGDVNISGGTNIFGGSNATDGNTARYGGAIYSGAGNVILSDDDALAGDYNLFENNVADHQGGAIWGDTVTLESGKNTFKSNVAGVILSGFGGAIYGDVVTICDGENTFEENQASRGGAILGSTVNIIDGTNRFENNTADTYGGAIYGDNLSTINISGGTNIFSENSATYGGGAIYGDTISIIGGVNTFEDNATTYNRGGAIYAIGNATLIAKAGAGNGDIKFQGNTDSTGANAIHMINNGNDKTLTLAAEAGRSILFYDPVSSSDFYPNLTISINNGASYTGTVLFDDHLSDIYGNTTVYGGTMHLTNGAIYGAADDVGTFVLNSGATLLSDVNSNTIQAGSITIGAGSTLAFDMTGAVEVGAGSTTNLVLLSDTSIASTFSGQTVHIDSFAGGTGTYNLAIGDENSFLGWGAATLTGVTSTTGRAIYGLTVAKTTYDNDTLQLTTIIQNGVMKWDTASGGIWNTTNGNWDGQDTTGNGGVDLAPETIFVNGDAVWFDDAAGGTITIQATGVTIAARPAVAPANHTNPGMEISSGDWIFTGGAINGTGTKILFSGNGSISFGGTNLLDTRTVTQHIDVADSVNATIKAEDGKTVTFKDFTTTASGAAIYSGTDSTTNLGETGSTGTLVFSDNTADYYGGAIYGGSGSSSSVNLLGGTNTFTGNRITSINGRGGAINSMTVNLIGGTNNFINNLAMEANGQGGAIYGSSTVTISGGTNTFEGNSAMADGGAIYSPNIVAISGGTNTFGGNTAAKGNTAVRGGAIYSNTVNVTGGTNIFENNEATGLGGAIYAANDAKLIADDGDITFQGNTDSTGANAIYMQNNLNDKILTLASEAGRKILFYDPVTSNLTNPNLTIAINHDGTAATDGTVKFDGSYWLSQGKNPDDDPNYFTSKIYGDTTVHGGTMQLANRVTYGGSTSVGSFTLNSGATLLSDVNSNTIQAGSITISAGSTLAFDMTGAVKVGETGATMNLVLLSDTSIASTFSTQKVHIVSFAGGTGTYNLAIGDEDSFLNWENATLTGVTSITGRAEYGLKVAKTTYDNDTLQLTTIIKNGVMKWDTASGGIWNTTNGNWDGQDTRGNGGVDLDPETIFVNGDAVWFDDAAGGTIAIQSEGVTIAARPAVDPIYHDNPGMEISSGDWIFTGGDINGTGTKILFSGNGSASFGGTNLLDTRTVQQHIDVANNVNATIKAEDGKTVTFKDFTTATNGGAIYGGTNSTINLGESGSTGTLVFSNNKVSDQGGAVAAANGSIALSGGTNTFTGNEAVLLGGAIYSSGSGTITLSDGTNTFIGNKATGATGAGGAIYGVDAINLSGGANTFTNNEATALGGAIYSFNNLTLSGGTNTFTGNKTTGVTGFGGAIYGDTIDIIGGTNVFTNNEATDLGGAIYATGDTTLIAKTGIGNGNITFQGNTDSTGANALYMYNDGNNKTLTLAAETNREIRFYDPIASDSSNQNLTIDINTTDGGTTVTDGTVAFDGSYWISQGKNPTSDAGYFTSNVYGNTTVYSGTMQLANGVTYGAANNTAGSFTLEDGATLLTDVHFNKIQAGTITFDSNGILAFDMTGAVKQGEPDATINLTLDGAVDTSTQKIGEGQINVTNLNYFGLKTGDKIALVDSGDINNTADTGTLDIQSFVGTGNAVLAVDAANRFLYLQINTGSSWNDLSDDLRPNAEPIPDVLDELDSTSPVVEELRKYGSEEEMIHVINEMPGDIFANAQFAVADLRKEFNGLLPSHRDFLEDCAMPDWNFEKLRKLYRGQNSAKSNNNIWGLPTGIYATRNTHAGYYGYDLGNTGIAVGKTWWMDNKQTIGIALGYDYTRLEMQHVSQKDDIQSLDLALYGGYSRNCSYLDWHIGYAKNWHDTRRIIGGTIANSTYDDNVFSAGATAGRRFGPWIPSIGIELIQVWSPSHTETGNSPFLLHVNKGSYTSLEVPIGTRLTNTWTTKNRNLKPWSYDTQELSFTPEIRAFWVPQLADKSSNMMTSFASGSSEFLVDSGNFGGQHFRLGTGLTTKFNDTFSASVNYDAAIHSGQTRHTAGLSMLWRF